MKIIALTGAGISKSVGIPTFEEALFKMIHKIIITETKNKIPAINLSSILFLFTKTFYP